MAGELGPYIQAASFCDGVIEDKHGVLSLIRLVDTLISMAQGSDVPSEMPPVQWAGKLVIMLKAGRATGRHELAITPELPSGETKDPLKYSVQMIGEERGQNLVVNFAHTFTMEGLYWFRVDFDGNFLTRIPFRVQYNRVVTGTSKKPL